MTQAEQTSADAGEGFYVCRLFPPRPSFVNDMTGEEAALMQAHVAYWTALIAKGEAVVFGPVADPGGPWGLAVVHASSSEHLREIVDSDPVTTCGKGFRYELLFMPQAITARGATRIQEIRPQT